MTDAAPAKQRTVTIRNQRGLHARAAAKFVKLVAEHGAEVKVQRGEMAVCGRSIMGLMMLAASTGTQITLFSEGPQAEAALSALVELIERKFDEE